MIALQSQDLRGGPSVPIAIGRKDAGADRRDLHTADGGQTLIAPNRDVSGAALGAGRDDVVDLSGGDKKQFGTPAVDLDARDDHGNPSGEITPQGGSATKRTGVIGLEISPALRELLATMRPKNARGGVWGLTRDQAKAAAKRLARHGAPDAWSWQVLRSSCGTYLTNSPGIFGAASAYRSAKQLGHSVAVAERHYVGVLRGIPREATTLEAAMQIEQHMQRVTEAAKARIG